mgnify:CR=1 FL=1
MLSGREAGTPAATACSALVVGEVSPVGRAGSVSDLTVIEIESAYLVFWEAREDSHVGDRHRNLLPWLGLTRSSGNWYQAAPAGRVNGRSVVRGRWIRVNRVAI